MENFETAFNSFISGAQAIVSDNDSGKLPYVQKLISERGKRYIRVVRIEVSKESGERLGHSGSAHCFIDMTNGNVLKPAGWKTPAKHARGNIFDDRNGLKHMGMYGPAYLR